MTRNSKHSRPTSFPKTRQNLQDQLLATRLRMEQIKLEQLEASHKPPTPEYTRWEDLPPPSPEDEARYYEDFKKIFHAVAYDGPNAARLAKDRTSASAEAEKDESKSLAPAPKPLA